MIKKNILLNLCLTVSFYSNAELKSYVFKRPFIRPKSVQKAVDEAFEENKDATKEWLYNGSPWYTLLGIDEELLIKDLVSKGKKDIYIVDVGCGRGSWGCNIKKILETEYKDSDTTFHIFSLTGGKECSGGTTSKGNVILHQLNQFKIENIDEELKKRGFDLSNKVDIIVSRWTLCHLADPFGTVDKLYGLLTPSGGTLLSSGFFFKLSKSPETRRCPGYSSGRYIFANSNASALFRDYLSGGRTDQFLLERNDEKPLGLPLIYTSWVERVDRYTNQCASGVVMEFSEDEDALKINSESIDTLDKDDRYCLSNDEKCKDLYMRLKQRGLFEKPEQPFKINNVFLKKGLI